MSLKLNDNEIRDFFQKSLKNINRDYDLKIEQSDIISAVWNPRVQKTPHNIFISCLGQEYQFIDIDDLSNKFCYYLLDKVKNKTLTSNAKIAIQMPNITQYVVVLLGALKAGMTVVNCNPLYTETEIEHQLKDSEAEMLFVFANISANFANIEKKTNIKEVVFTELFDLHPNPKKTIMNFLVKKVKKMVPTIPSHWKSFSSVLKKGGDLYLKVDKKTMPKIKKEDTAFLQYTGGTTGISKGAELTHYNMVANSLQGVLSHRPEIAYADKLSTNKESNGYMLCPLPLYHIYSLTSLFAFGMRAGICCVLVPNPRDQKMLFKDLLAYEYSIILGINTLYVAMMNNPLMSQVKLSNTVECISGGMAMLPEIADRWFKQTGQKIVEGYGSTEMSPVALFSDWTNPQSKYTGFAVGETLMKLIDDNGNDLPLGDDEIVGELLVKGPQIMKGYYKKPEENDKVLIDGWFKSGDMAKIYPNGGVKLVDRKKDMIIVSGFNVYPNEVEDIIQKYPFVIECAVVGKMDNTTGSEIIHAYIVAKEGFETNELLEHCKQHLVNYKMPKKIIIVKELPKNNVGKIVRRMLRD